ncbi:MULTISPECIES: nitroreductase family protein [unclassified Moraxella]
MHKSCGLVAQTFMLAMSEKGLDTCPMEGFDGRVIKELLNLPKSSEINMVVSCGVRSDKGVWGDRFRVPFAEVYHKI